MSDMSIEGTAGVCQQKGKELYTCGNYAGAVAAYSEGLQQLKRLGSAANVARSTLLGNRAACHLALGDATAAEADCKAGLAQAASPKLYYRLAKALMDPSRQNLDAAGAAAAMAAAVALLQPPVCQCSMSEEMTRLYTKLESLTHASGFQGPELPHNPSSICHAACTQTLCYALSTGAEFIVLNPGSYRLPAQLSAAGGFTLLGIGSVQLLSEVSHALWLQQGTITLVNVQLAGSGQHAAVCVTTPTTSFFPMCGAASSSCVAPRLRMIDCRVINYSEAGLLVCGGHAFLIRCSFKNCRLQAVEVREGGSLTAHQTVVDHCLQGVTAYGGARSVKLIECSITNTSKEGVLAEGTYENAATVAQHGVINKRLSKFRDGATRQVTEAADAWGKQHGVPLDVEVRDCTIATCGNFGVSADAGSSVLITGCRLESNDPYAVVIKGGTDVNITACQFVFGGRSSKSLWAQAAKTALKLSGVQIGINYGGTVRVLGCAFAGPEAEAIVNEIDMPGSSRSRLMMLGLWTKPPLLQRNEFFSQSNQLPTLEQLSARLAMHLPAASAASRVAGEKRSARTPTAPELCRPGGTIAKQGWSVTNVQYYAIGNTFGVDVSGGLLLVRQPAAAAADLAGMSLADTSRVYSNSLSNSAIHVLLAGCGDLRNLLATAAAVMPAAEFDPSSGNAIGQPAKMHFVLNDGNLSMLARDAVMMHMVVELAASPEAVLAVWANHALTEEQHTLLVKSCIALAEQPWPVWLSASSWLTDISGQQQQRQQEKECQVPHQDVVGPVTAASSTEAAVETAQSSGVGKAEQSIRAICAAWAGTSMTLAQLLELRSQQHCSALILQSAIELSMTAVDSCGITEGGLSRAVQADIHSYIRTGSLSLHTKAAAAAGRDATTSRKSSKQQQQLTQPNVTFLAGTELQYTIYYSSSIFRAVLLAPAVPPHSDGCKAASATVTERLLEAVRPQVAAVAAAATGGRMTVCLVPGDILMLATAAGAVEPAAAPGGRITDERVEGAENDATCCQDLETPGTSTSAVQQQASVRGVPCYYDYIDTSNVSDYTSLPALLQACALLLKPEPHARLRLESIVAHQKHSSSSSKGTSAEQYIQHCLGGVDPSKHASLLGLKFLGTAAVPGHPKALRLLWSPADDAACSSGAASSCHTTNSTSSEAPSIITAAPASRLATTRAIQTPVGLFLDLKSAWKHFVEAYFVEPSRTSGHNASASPAQGGQAHGTPLTLLHLLVVALPPVTTEAMLQALLRTAANQGPKPAGSLALFDWELTLHAGINAGSVERCVRITYPANPGLNLLGHDETPLLLALSPEPLMTGPVSWDAVKQLFSTFVWDEDMATATVLLPPEVVQSCPRWAAYITLCVASDNGLESVGKSRQLASLLASAKASGTHKGFVAVRPWLKPLCSAKQLQFEQPGELLLDCSLLDKVGRSGRNSWESVSHGEAATAQLIVDILAPSAIHKDALVLVFVKHGQLTVSITAGKEKKGLNRAKPARAKGAAGLCEAQYSKELPPGVADGDDGQPAVAVKLSRALGLLSVRVR